MANKRFTKTGEGYEDGSRLVEYTLDLREGHTITRVDTITTLGAGHKGRSARVDTFRALYCSCGGEARQYDGTVSEVLALVPHYESEDERLSAEHEQAERVRAIQEALGLV